MIEANDFWQDGDVVSNGGVTVLVRVGGKWHQVTEHGTCQTDDGTVLRNVIEGSLRIERRQMKPPILDD